MTDHRGADEGHAIAPRQPARRILPRKEAIKAGTLAAGAAWLLTLGHPRTVFAGGAAQGATAEPMTSARLLSIMQAERAEWEDLLARVGEARMTEPNDVTYCATDRMRRQRVTILRVRDTRQEGT